MASNTLRSRRACAVTDAVRRFPATAAAASRGRPNCACRATPPSFGCSGCDESQSSTSNRRRGGNREEFMTRPKTGRARMLAAFGALLAGALPARAADTTYERLVNPEPQNWLMNHRDYTAHRDSALHAINRNNAKNLKLLFAVALGGPSNNESLEATPLVEDGYMYLVDSWGIVSKIDVRSGTSGPVVC